MKYKVKFRDKESVVYGYDSDEYISGYLTKGTFYEEPLLTYISEKYYSIKSVVDAGANIGNHAVFFHDIMGVTNITAFEPNPDNFMRLKKSAPFADLHQVALSDVEEKVTCSFNLGNMGAGFCQPDANGSEWSKTLDSYDLEPDLIKIDCEGMETQVLEGAIRTIQRAQPVLFVEHNDIQHLYDFNRTLEKTGVRYIVKPFVTKSWEVFEYLPERKYHVYPSHNSMRR